MRHIPQRPLRLHPRANPQRRSMETPTPVSNPGPRGIRSCQVARQVSLRADHVLPEPGEAIECQVLSLSGVSAYAWYACPKLSLPIVYGNGEVE